MPTAIKVENLSKAYQLGQFSTGTLSHDLHRWWAQFRGKEDPFLKIGETNDRTSKGESSIVWSLKDINFEIEQGTAVGIIGRNGAGKSTLLKILSQVTSPTSGSVKVNGRVASLLEVGTGFHPELTGRENILLNGTILGMRKREILSKFDEIVDFSGVERYIDTPVKRYSSGMYVRLAFAVAAHLESEILIVDEVLAVGDLEFQKKCLGKMGEVSSENGRTILFVSHNLTAIKKLCSRSILIDKGQLLSSGATSSVLENYSDLIQEGNSSLGVPLRYNANFVELVKISLLDEKGEPFKNLTTDDQFTISFEFETVFDNTEPGITLILKDNQDAVVFSSINSSDSSFRKRRKHGEKFVLSCTIPKSFLNAIQYKVSLVVFEGNYSNSSFFEDIYTFKVDDSFAVRKDYLGEFGGLIRPLLDWKSN